MRRVGLILLCALLTACVAVPAAQAQHKHGHHKKHKHKKHKHSNGLNRLLAPESSCPGQSDAGAAPAAQEATMECMINYTRSKAGHGSLADAAKLDTSANDKADDILQCDDFSHTACGRSFTYYFDQIGYIVGANTCYRVGENIAWGSGDLGTVRSIADAWIHSPEHLANMLSDSFSQFGVGYQVGNLNGYDGAHVWVTHFGDHC